MLFLNFNKFLYSCAILLCLIFVSNVSSEHTQLHTTAEQTLVEPSCADIKRNEIENHLSTKTPYRIVANLDEKPYKFGDCQSRRIWSVIRHGTRNPSKKVIKAAEHLLMSLKHIILQQQQSHFCSEELERLRFWQFNVSTSEQKYLVPEGEDELIELAERMQKRFPKLLPEDYDASLYHFKYTATQRTLLSAQSFATGLFGRQRLGEIIYPKALKKDPVLRFYKLCKRWKHDVDKNPDTLNNLNKFLEQPVMQDAINYIRRKLQIDITPNEAQLIYNICAFETAWNRRQAPSIWCSLFNRDTIKAFEFAEDLEYYWNDGYGYELTHKIACPAIADMFDYIDPNSTKPNATFYFTHSGTLLKVLAHLGLYKDATPLTYADFQKQRFWRTSAIDTFATNVAFVLYDCANREPQVLTLHQERPVHIPGCPEDSELCSLSTLRQIFAKSLQECNFEEYCKLSRAHKDEETDEDSETDAEDSS